MFKKFTDFLERVIQPIAVKMSQNTVISSITSGMMGIIPITVGVSFVSILVNLPIPAWLEFLSNSGIKGPATELISATTSMLAIYIVMSVAMSYARNVNQDVKANAVIATAVFIVLMPQTITVGETTVSALLSSNLGSNGIFVAIIVGITVGVSYDFLMKKNIRLKLPEQVPANVTESMNPILVAMIIFTVTFIIKYLLTLTSYGNIYTLLYEWLTKPAMNMGTSGWSAVFFYFTLRSIFWFFGIHPSPLNAVYFPILTMVQAANVEAYLAGQPLPYLAFNIMGPLCMIGGSACTLGLALNMFKAKSERYKALNKIAFIPGLFNINEPYVFGVPLMMNPTMLIPMVLAPLSGGAIGYLFINLGLINSVSFNPSISVAWVMPSIISGFLRGGVMMMLAVLLALIVQTAIYFPFFKVLDKQAYKEEQDSLK